MLIVDALSVARARGWQRRDIFVTVKTKDRASGWHCLLDFPPLLASRPLRWRDRGRSDRWHSAANDISFLPAGLDFRD